jgi:hypothetical protein
MMNPLENNTPFSGYGPEGCGARAGDHTPKKERRQACQNHVAYGTKFWQWRRHQANEGNQGQSGF